MIVVEGGIMSEKIVDLFNDIIDLMSESEVPSPIAFSVLMKLSALTALHSDMKRADFLRAADMVFKIESFIVEDVKNLPMQ